MIRLLRRGGQRARGCRQREAAFQVTTTGLPSSAASPLHLLDAATSLSRSNLPRYWIGSKRYFRDNLWSSISEELDNPTTRSPPSNPNYNNGERTTHRHPNANDSKIDTSGFSARDLELLEMIQKKKFQDAFDKIQAITKSEGEQDEKKPINGEETERIHQSSIHPAIFKEFLTVLARGAPQYPQNAAMAEQLLQLQEESSQSHQSNHGLVVMAWANSGLKEAGDRALSVLETAIQKHYNIHTDDLSRDYNHVLRAYANNGKLVRAEQILEIMAVDPDAIHFGLLVHYHVKAGNVERADELVRQAFQRRIYLPTSPPLNGILQLYSQKCTSSQNNIKVIAQMESFYRELVVDPDQNSYTHRLNAHVNANNPLGAEAAFKDILQKIASNSIPNSNPPLLTKHLNLILKAWVQSSSQDKFDKALAIMKSIQEQHAHGSMLQLDLELDNSSYYTVLVQCADEGRAREATQLFEFMEYDYETGNPNAKPTTKTFGLWMKALARYGDPNAGPQAELVLKKMKEYQEFLKPDAVIYTSMRNCWLVTKRHQQNNDSDRKAFQRIGELNQLIEQADRVNAKQHQRSRNPPSHNNKSRRRNNNDNRQRPQI